MRQTRPGASPPGRRGLSRAEEIAYGVILATPALALLAFALSRLYVR